MEVKSRIPGQIVAVAVKVGDPVKMRSVLGTIESMKMEQPIPCPTSGTVKEVRVEVGSKVKSGEVMFVVE